MELSLPQALGAGETEAIRLAVESNSAILVDERFASVEASKRGLPIIGTIALLDLADEAGLLGFEQAMTLLLRTTFHIERSLVDTDLAKVRSRKNAG